MSGRVGSLLPTVITLLTATTGSSSHSGDAGKVIKGPFSEPWDVFISYCEPDQRFAKRIRVHLKPIEDEGVRIYDYDMVEPGAVVGKEARAALLTSVVAVLLISADYLASDLMKHDLPRLLDQAEEKDEESGSGHTRILWLYTGTCDLSEMPRLTRYQQVGDRKRPLDQFRREADRDVIYVQLLRAIRKRLKECNRHPEAKAVEC